MIAIKIIHENPYEGSLEEDLNWFCSTHKIISISYSRYGYTNNSGGLGFGQSALIVYEKEEK
jgi:hypothetical protein